MSNLLTLADAINQALDTGHEATFIYNGTTYTFSPAGILTFLAATQTGLAGLTSSIDELNILDGVGATAAELNFAADKSSYVLELTATAAVPATIRVVELNHATVVIAATYTVVPNTLFIIKDTSASGTEAHTVTISGGTFHNGAGTIATLNARDEFLVTWFDSASRGTTILNVGAVALT